MDFQNFQKSNFDGGKFLKILSSINLPWDHMMSHKKFGPDRFSRFDVWSYKRTDKQLQTDKPNLYIEGPLFKNSGMFDSQWNPLDLYLIKKCRFSNSVQQFQTVLIWKFPFFSMSKKRPIEDSYKSFEIKIPACSAKIENNS